MIALSKEDFLKKVSRFERPELVAIDEEAIKNTVIGQLPDVGASEPAPECASESIDIIHFALCLNALNHQFWDMGAKGFTRYTNGPLTGAMAMKAGLENLLTSAGSIEALIKKTPLGEADIAKFFGEIPDLAERAHALNEALGAKGQAAARLLNDESSKWGLGEAGAIAALLPFAYEDPFLKKAQLALFMAQGMLRAKGKAAPEIETTCFADYQVPKVLKGMGILKYARALEEKIKKQELIASGSQEEQAIRAAAISACEKLAKEKNLSPAQLDYFLWSRRNDHKEPFHLTRTRRY